MVRSLGGASRLPARFLPPTPALTRESMSRAASGEPPALPPYPYATTAFLSAAAEGEVALDLNQEVLTQYPTLDGKPHGALTDALLRVLEGELPADLDGSGELSLDEVHRSVSAYLASRGLAQSPRRLPAIDEDPHQIGGAPVLLARGVASAPVKRPPAPLRLALSEGLAPELPGALRGVPGLALVEGREADLVLRRAGNLQLRTASNDLIYQLPGDDVVRLRGNLTQLAWAHRLRQLAENHRRGVLPIDITPSRFGGNFRFGQTLAFVVKPDKPAYLLLLNIDARGRVSTLYPARASETAALAGGEARHIPGTNPRDLIQVQAPEGLDLQFAFAFDQPPPAFERIVGMSAARADDPRLLALEALLPEIEGRFTFAHTELRSLH